MEITTKKSIQVRTEMLDCIKDGECVNDFSRQAQKWADELVRDTFDTAGKCRKFFHGDVVEFSVTITIADPKEDATD